MSRSNQSSLQFEDNENNFESLWNPISVRASPLRSVEKEGSKSTICRGISDRNANILEEITNFEVREDRLYGDDYNVQLEPIAIRSDSTSMILPSSQQMDVVQQNKCDLDIGPKLLLQSPYASQQPTDADIFRKSLKTEKVGLAEELQFVPQEYNRLSQQFVPLDNCTQIDKTHQVLSLLRECHNDFYIKELQVRLDRITGNLEEAQTLNSQYLEDICEEGKLESNIRSSDLLKEVVAFQSELLEKFCFMAEDNEKLRSTVVAKEEKIREINTEWEKASLELTSFLLDGSKSVRDASDEIKYIADSFAHVSIDIGEHIESAAKFCVEKEEKILLLERSLEDAQKTVSLMQQNLISLRGAAIVLTELQQLETSSTKESIQMTTTLNDKINKMSFKNKLPSREAQTFRKNKFSSAAAAASLEMNMEADCTRIVLGDNEDYIKDGTSGTMNIKSALLLENSEIQAELAKLGLPECDIAVNVSFADSEIGGRSSGEGSCLLASHALDSKDHNLLKTGHNQFIMPEMIGVLRPADLVMHEADASCCSTMKFVADGKVHHDCVFFNQFEEACASMHEAEVMINALLKANENSRQLASKWKQSGEILMIEKASLVEDIKQLKFSLHVKDDENERLHEQIRYSLLDMSNMMSLLEGSLLNMQKDTEAMCKAIYSDALMWAKEIQSIICFSRSSVECIYAQVLKKEFASFVLHQFSVAEYFKNYRSLDGVFIHHTVGDKDTLLNSTKGKEERDQNVVATTREAVEMGKELEDIEIMLQGLLHEFSMLQKSASTSESRKTETKSLVPPLSQTWHELQMKASQLDVLVVQIAKHESLFVTNTALFASNSDLEQLEEKGEAIKILEKKVVLAKSSLERQLLSLLDSIESDLSNVTTERDQLGKQVVSLQDRLDMAYALASENEAIAVKVHQEAEAGRIHTEQKEEEVKILKQLVGELEGTINVLEKKGYEMEDEVKRHQQIQYPLEIELKPQRHRPLNSTNEPAEDQLIRKLHSRSVELHEAHNHILNLEAEIAEQSEEIKWCKGYISELVLHAEAQSSQYQQKYKTLEAMVREVKTESSNLASASPNIDTTEKRSMRARRSSSPFRCMMGGMVQQKILVKDQELSTAMFRIQELEALLVSRQKEVCLLNTRLASTESMTHDIIRDLLGVKLDMTNYANMMDHHQVQKIVKDTQQQTHRSIAMEKEILKLRRQINDLIEERNVCILEVNRREADICDIQMDVEQIQEREQLLIAENVLLKTEKINLHRRVAELDEMVTKVFGTQTNQPRVQQQIDCLLKSRCTDFRERPRNSEKQLRGVNDELPQYCKPESSHTQAKLGRR